MLSKRIHPISFFEFAFSNFDGILSIRYFESYIYTLSSVGQSVSTSFFPWSLFKELLLLLLLLFHQLLLPGLFQQFLLIVL